MHHDKRLFLNHTAWLALRCSERHATEALMTLSHLRLLGTRHPDQAPDPAHPYPNAQLRGASWGAHIASAGQLAELPKELQRRVPDLETTTRSRYGNAVVADALTFAAEEDQLALAHALVVDGAWLHRGRSGNRHLLTIARRMAELLPADQVQRVRDSLTLAQPGPRQHIVGRRLLKTLAGAHAA